jgi:hypothetical protein
MFRVTTNYELPKGGRKGKRRNVEIILAPHKNFPFFFPNTGLKPHIPSSLIWGRSQSSSKFFTLSPLPFAHSPSS